MAKQTINLGTTPNDGTGTPLRDAFDMVNDNFNEVYGEDFVTNARLANITRGSIKVGGTGNAPTDLDAKGDAKILIGNGTDLVSVAVSGDISIDNTGNVTISDTAVENIMLGDDAVGADELASNAVVTASIQDDAVTPAKINILDDSLAATNAHIMVGDGTDFSNVAISGDIGITNTGAVTIQPDAIEQSMIADDAVGADQLATDAVVTASIVDDNVTPAKINILQDDTVATDGHILVGDGTDFANVALSGELEISNTGAVSLLPHNMSVSTNTDFSPDSSIFLDSRSTIGATPPNPNVKMTLDNFIDGLTKTTGDKSIDKDNHSQGGGMAGPVQHHTGFKIASAGIRFIHAGQQFTGRKANEAFSSGNDTIDLTEHDSTDGSTGHAIYELTLPGDGTNVTIRPVNFDVGRTVMIILNTDASTAHTGTVTFFSGSGAAPNSNNYDRLSPQDIDQSANKKNYIFLTCIKNTDSSGAYINNRDYIYTVSLAQ